MLYREIVENLSIVGIPYDHVLIRLNEITRRIWGVQSGLPVSEVDFGVKIEG
jgi:hypothetical protein